MKLVILGATGPMGQCLVMQALEAGHDVTAVVRNPDKINTTHDKLKVVKGDIFSESSLHDHMMGHEAVLSCLGSHGSWLADCTLYSESIKSITAAMRVANVNRFMGITSWFTSSDKGTFMMDWIIKPFLLKKILRDMGAMETYLMEECQDINYTVIKPPGLGNGNETDKLKAEEGQQLHGSSYFGLTHRSDITRFMLTCLDTDKWDRKLVSVGY